MRAEEGAATTHKSFGKREGRTTMSTKSESPGLKPVDARIAEIAERFGERLTAEQRLQVRTRIERTIALSVAMRATPLTNADEPEIVFSPYRGKS